MREVHHHRVSDLAMVATCPLKAAIASITEEPSSKSENLFFGELAHALAYDFLSTRKVNNNIPSFVKTMLETGTRSVFINDVKKFINELEEIYFNFVEYDFTENLGYLLHLEHEVEKRIHSCLIVHGTIDAVFWNSSTGIISIVDWKTDDKTPNLKYLARDPKMNFYREAFEETTQDKISVYWFHLMHLRQRKTNTKYGAKGEFFGNPLIEVPKGGDVRKLLSRLHYALHHPYPTPTKNGTCDWCSFDAECANEMWSGKTIPTIPSDLPTGF